MAGEIGQCDFWFPDVVVPVGYGQVRTATALPVLTMVCGYSRWASALLIPTRTAEDLYAGWWQHLSTLGAVPRVLVWDGEGAVGRWWARQPELTAACHAFRGTLAAKVWICKPVIPKPRGWSNVSTTTWSGRSCRVGSLPLRRISIPSCRPGWCGPITASTECWDVDRQWRTSTRLPRDHYVRLDGNDYSVHPVAIGRRIEITADLSRVRVWCGGTLVADHDRIWAKHQTISDPEHVVAAKLLRRKRFDIVGPPHHVEVEQRLLTTYDTVLGLDGPVA